MSVIDIYQWLDPNYKEPPKEKSHKSVTISIDLVRRSLDRQSSLTTLRPMYIVNPVRFTYGEEKSLMRLMTDFPHVLFLAPKTEGDDIYLHKYIPIQGDLHKELLTVREAFSLYNREIKEIVP